MSSRDEGAVAPQFLAVLLLASALAGGATMILSTATFSIARAQKSDERRTLAMAIIEEIEKAFNEDSTPNIDSSDDPGWDRNGTADRGFKIRVIPVSDRINPNFVRKNVFEKTGLSGLLSSDSTADALQQFREDKGLQITDEQWEVFFKKDDYTRFFSVWGWANVNLVDEFAVRSLATTLTGSDTIGEMTRDKIRRILMEQRIEKREEMRTFLGMDYEALFPAINAEPSMNINFVPERILREILAYPDYGIERPSPKADSIISARETGPLDAKDLSAALGVETDNRVLCYFGSITWFREILLEDDDGFFSAVIARIPTDDGSEGKKTVFARMQLREYR